MTEEAPIPAPVAAQPRWRRRLAIALGGLLALGLAGLLLLDSSIGHRFIADRIGALRPSNGLRYAVGRIDGSVFGHAMLNDVRVYDRKGLVLVVPRASLSWAPLAWLSNRLEIRQLTIPQARLVKLPEVVRTGKPSPVLPSFDILIGMLRVDRLAIDRVVTGTARTGSLAGRADIHKGRALIDLRALVEGSDRLLLKLDVEPDRDRFDIDLRAEGAANGLTAKLARLTRPIRARIAGVGRWSRWRGTALADVGGKRVVDLALGNRSGAYTLTGALTPSGMSSDKLVRMALPGIAVNGAATLVDRQLDGELTLRSSALAIDVGGGVDLAASGFRKLRIRTQLLQPPALLPKMVGRKVELRAILDGAFATAAFEYRLTADFVSFGKEGFNNIVAAGKGRLSKQPIVVPLHVSVASVTGVDKVAGEILRNLTLDGKLQITAALITGSNLQFKSDKLNGSFNVLVDLKNGRFDIGIDGGLGRYLIPGLGIVDVVTMLHVVPDPNGKGARILGSASAQVIRLDNEFFRSLAGGLPRLAANLEQSTDGVLHFSSLVLTAPDIRITGAGYHRRDGSFYFEGVGTQRTYGPLTLKLDGRIERPTVDITLAHPNDTLGLSTVRAHLDPTPEGYAFTANGGSTLGDFVSHGRLLLPRNQRATIVIEALDAGGIKANGALLAAAGGFDGTLTVTGGGVTGAIGFAPANGVQRIEAHLDAANAQVLGDSVLRRGRLDLVTMLYPQGASVEASVKGSGLRRGALGLARFEGTASLRGGVGTIKGAIAGARGRAFDIRGEADVTADRYRITAGGTIDRRPVKLLTPAIVTRVGDGWLLAPTKLAFAGGNAEVGGRFSSDSAAIDATVAQLPLTILDIVYPGLGLTGSASGQLSYSDGRGAAPVGKMDMTVRGLSRSGLVLSSKPIDLGVAGVLQANNAALRAVMVSGGKTIGRAQARLSPLGAGSLKARLANAQLFAQVRYDGPADTLWRLTGIELFDLSGPIQIGADLGGKVNDPRIRGVVRAKGARIESGTTGTVLTGVEAAGTFNGSQLSFENFAADAGKGGRVTGSGSFDFAAVNGFGIDLRLQADKAVMINRDDIAATVTGPLTIHSSGSGGVIAGDVTLNASRYRLGQAVAATAVPQLNIREINLPDDMNVEEDRPLAPWRLDIHAKARDGLRVSGLGLSSEWTADLRIGGAPDNPAITGRADIIRGSYEFSGREFDIERGVIRFGGETPANPVIDISANADSTGLSAKIQVTGPATRPEISFSSVPALPQDELLSRLLFGTSITNLSAPEALQLAAAVAALQGGGNGLNPINALRRVAGLDRLRILPADTSVGRTGSSVAAGKFITRKLYAEIISDGAGYSATQIEFRVTRWLSILSTISTIGRQSANIRVSKDY
ncbi:translocation/assembly module TamB [Sphingomonas sp. 28-63-12]|uniref:translocation/assembly module TamB n=1 Tax=Sphingomonas sp. 28-63-12 TaxID=1970434 RepID=UPI000BCBC1E4|nr:MAG: hypothetical protein B7Y47_03075 [Sphingomonas sp. 28-63-12]